MWGYICGSEAGRKLPSGKLPSNLLRKFVRGVVPFGVQLHRQLLPVSFQSLSTCIFAPVTEHLQRDSIALSMDLNRTYYQLELSDLALASSTFLRTADFFSTSNISFSIRFRNSSQASIDINSVRW